MPQNVDVSLNAQFFRIFLRSLCTSARSSRASANFKLRQLLSLEHVNKKQCSRQLQCEVPCAGNVVNSSCLLVLSSPRGGGGVGGGGGSSRGSGRGRGPGRMRGLGGRRGGWGRGRGLGEGEGAFHLPCHVLHYHMVLRPKRDFAQQTTRLCSANSCLNQFKLCVCQ